MKEFNVKHEVFLSGTQSEESKMHFSGDKSKPGMGPKKEMKQ